MIFKSRSVIRLFHDVIETSEERYHFSVALLWLGSVSDCLEKEVSQQNPCVFFDNGTFNWRKSTCNRSLRPGNLLNRPKALLKY